MKHLLILGGGTAGTMVANRVLHRLRVERDFWRVTVVDRDDRHLYQPGLLTVPFGAATPEQLVRSRRRYLEPGVELVLGEVEGVDTARGRVHLEDGRVLPYDYLVVASGTSPRPDQTPGMAGDQWRRRVHEFYTPDGAVALHRRLERWLGGRIVVHVTEMPIKCPVAPLEFTFLLDDALRRRGLRAGTELTYVTPLDGAFTRPVARDRLGGMLEARGVQVRTDFLVDRVDDRRLVSVDDREVPFDLLVTVPVNLGADFVARSGLGDELQDVPVDPGTLMSRAHPGVFAVGDATDVPTSKAGSVAHFEADVFADNLVSYDRGRPMTRLYDGHANCFVESGRGRALLLDFGYDAEPLPGRYPLPVIGPLSLLAETRANHWAKAATQRLYWNVLLHGRPVPIPSRAPRREPAATGAAV
ncbi:NAD(P)/FAD-dependent oxidoreductase [Cellulomonas sp. C5510]|uniref:type III sulfide quinone reductase, selenoprotein subtype n=1 Tax=Cellulomonas sp. C5510 TaxID=2871170 RepID=UPI001C971875|nr:FAD/NAD(P)-binding oxidoreductase [Cellulomonas sp. C5510]QZN86978.1 NAD(P)/FAD-dependent oxidoreductase [Cellulomonas sp. C5510]